MRMRLFAAFGLITLLVLATAGAGAWGIAGLHRTSLATLQGDVGFATTVRQLKSDLLELRRFEKDTFINMGDTKAVESYHGKWSTAREHALHDLDGMRAFPTGRKPADEFADHLKAYSDGYEATLKLIQSGKLVTTREANTYFTQFKDEIRSLDELSKSLAAEADARIAGIQPSLDARARTAMVAASITVCFAFLVALVLAVLTTRRVMLPLVRARGLAVAISKGELDNELVVEGNDEFSDTLAALQAMDRKLAEMVASVRDTAEQVAAAARDISQGNDDLSQRTQEQASSLEETAASMEQMTATVKQNAEGADHARQLAGDVRQHAAHGSSVARTAIEAMQDISKASEDIAQIVGLMDGIAFQTNLLALNAAVEAARAGHEGRGFAVVATEVRTLAQRSAAAAREIKQLITDSGDKVTHGAGLVGSTGRALEEIEAGVGKVSGIVEEIAAASHEQSSGIDQVNIAISAIDSVTQQNAALVEEASAASRSALELSQDLLRQVSFFRVRQAA